MSLKITLKLATAATLAMATLASQSADAGLRPIAGHLPVGGPVHIPTPVGPVHPIPVHIPPVHIPLPPPVHPIPVHIPPVHIPLRPVHIPPSGGGTRPIVPIPIHHLVPVLSPPEHHHHHHWVFRDGGWIMLDDEIEAAPVAAYAPAAPAISTPSPCSCLTKTYTRTGLAVFADVCTKESASAPVDSAVGDAAQTPTSPVAATAVPMSAVPTSPNYAGRTYEDYLAANPQATQP